LFLFKLKFKERCLDEQIRMMQINKSIIMQDESNLAQIYMTHDDIHQAFARSSNQSIILVKLNQDTQMEVPEPMFIYNNSSVKQKYQINLKSNSDPIDAYLLQKDLSEKIKVKNYSYLF